ncbi:muscarinic acetylcholine receptor M1-like [Diadema setosum]|uniref:muscarinic acetylcholine receptor M1-like n=1 Tax=Diadema setosum TaxID=31175 RepID=UPI003B3B29F3
MINITEITATVFPRPVVSYRFFLTLSLSVATVVTNAAILVAFARQRRLWTYTNYYILNMTLSDLLVGILIMPLRSTIILYGEWVFGRVAGAVFLMVQNGCLGVSVMGVVVITIDRYLATMYPMHHYTRKSKLLATVVNVFTWLIPFLFWFFFNLVWFFLVPNDLTTAQGLPRPNFTRTLGLAVMTNTIRFVCPLLIIMILYLRVYLQIRTVQGRRKSKLLASGLSNLHQKQQMCSEGESTDGQRRVEISINVSQESCQSSSAILADPTEIATISKEVCKQSFGDFDAAGLKNQPAECEAPQDNATLDYPEAKGKVQAPASVKRESVAEGRKAMRTLTFIVVAFALTWLPNIMSFTIYSISPATYRKINNAMNYTEVARWITYSNSMLNPMAYAMAQPLIRRTIVLIFCKRCHSSSDTCL